MNGQLPIEGFAMSRIDRSLLRRTQPGTALIITLVLVLLATLLALFAMNVGISEQRASGNDVRSRLVQQATEAALAQGMEYFKVNTTQVDKTATDAGGNALWAKCAFDDTSFPCGTVEQTFTFKDAAGTSPACPDGSAQPCARRATMYYFIGGSQDVNGNGSTTDTLDKRSVPLDRRITTAAGSTTAVGNNFAVNYGVGALLCMVKNPTAATDPTTCTTDMSKRSSVSILTLTAVGSINGESARTTLTQSVAQHSVIANPVGKPPVVASGNVTAKGTLQIVTNPNAGGSGVPISIWSRLQATYNNTGTPNTCYMDEFIRNQSGNATPIYEGTKPQVITCDTCACSASLSGTQGNTSTVGIDILDSVDHHAGGGNYAIKPGEFPCDMFQYIFGTQAWKDTDADGLCETALTTNYTSNGVSVSGGRVDEAYLYANATFIIPTSGNAAKVPASKLATCSMLQDSAPISATKGSAYGLVWDQQACGVGSNQQAGTPDWPVLLVEDGSTTVQGRIFGLVFVRSTVTPLVASTGGSGSLDIHGGAAIYGSVVLQGSTPVLNGTGAVIYNGDVLSNLGKQAPLNPFSPVPASWTDRFSY